MGLTIDGHDDARASLVSVRLPPDPSSVSLARRHLRSALRTVDREDLVDDAVLVMSELVTNALVHTGGEIGLDIRYGGRDLVVEVADGSVRIPQPRAYGRGAGTGRGLHLVQTVSDTWGYTPHRAGKTVWFHLSEAYDEAHEKPWTGHAPPEAAVHDQDGAELVTVELLNVPLLLHAAWREQAQAMLRDVLLAHLAEHEGEELAAIRRHAETTDAIGLLDESVPRIPRGLPYDRLIDPAAEPEVSVDRVTLHLSAASVGHFATLQEIGEFAKDLAERGKLLTPAPLTEIRAFREWFCREVRDQSQGLPAEPWALPGEQGEGPSSLAGPGCPTTPGWDPVQVRDSGTGVIAADAEGRILAVSRAALTLLGYDEPAELVGRRLVCIVPHRLRQAHLAGMTLYLVTDRRPILGAPVPVPALRRDGSEVMVELTIRSQDVPGERPVLVADLTALR